MSEGSMSEHRIPIIGAAEIVPFKIQVKQEILDDLKARLVRTRWPDEADGAGWLQGTSLSYMKELVDYWLNNFDWRVQER
jgi:microsomal epoxide hydrolase